MVADNNKLFFLSGIFSLSFFLLIVGIIGWQFTLDSKPLAFAMIQSDVISVSLDMSDSKISEAEPIVQESAPAEPTVQKSEPISQEKAIPSPVQPEITDLFSNVRTHAPSPKKESTNISKLNELEKKILSSKRESQLFEKVQNVSLAKSGVKMVTSASSGPMVNEYYAKVQGIIYANFHPASGTEGFSARVRISLRANGALEGYRVISYSGNAVFNAEVDWLKERLSQVTLPSHPQGESAVFDIILTAKD